MLRIGKVRRCNADRKLVEPVLMVLGTTGSIIILKLLPEFKVSFTTF